MNKKTKKKTIFSSTDIQHFSCLQFPPHNGRRAVTSVTSVSGLALTDTVWQFLRGSPCLPRVNPITISPLGPAYMAEGLFCSCQAIIRATIFCRWTASGLLPSQAQPALPTCSLYAIGYFSRFSCFLCCRHRLKEDMRASSFQRESHSDITAVASVLASCSFSIADTRSVGPPVCLPELHVSALASRADLCQDHMTGRDPICKLFNGLPRCTPY